MTLFQTAKSKLYFGIFLGFCALFFLYKHHHSAADASLDGVLIKAQKVKVGTIPIEAEAVSTLVATNNVELTSDVEGQVAKILVADGTYVKEGTAIIQLDDKVNKAKAESEKGKLTYAQENYNRMAFLGKKGAASQQNIDQAIADLKEKNASAEEAQVLLKKMVIVAPFDGVLGKVKVSPGEYITAGEKLVSLTDTKNLRAEFSVSEKYFPLLHRMGQQVNLKTTAYPGKEFYGKVSFISPTISTEDRTISLYADVPNLDNQLTSGLFMNATVLLGNLEKVLLIPAESLVATIDGEQVYKIVDGKAVAVPVTIGMRTDTQVEIVKGLSANDTVVVEGQQKLHDGTPVQIKT